MYKKLLFSAIILIQMIGFTILSDISIYAQKSESPIIWSNIDGVRLLIYNSAGKRVSEIIPEAGAESIPWSKTEIVKNGVYTVC